MVMQRDEALDIIRNVVAECLAREPQEVLPESRLITDLGADSLDFLDIVFTLEGAFNVRFRGSEFDFLARLDLASPEVVRDGFLTPQTLERLAPLFPQLNQFGESDGVRPAQLFSLITVETLWIVVEQTLQEKEK